MHISSLWVCVNNISMEMNSLKIKSTSTFLVLIEVICTFYFFLFLYSPENSFPIHSLYLLLLHIHFILTAIKLFLQAIFYFFYSNILYRFLEYLIDPYFLQIRSSICLSLATFLTSHTVSISCMTGVIYLLLFHVSAMLRIRFILAHINLFFHVNYYFFKSIIPYRFPKYMIDLNFLQFSLSICTSRCY